MNDYENVNDRGIDYLPNLGAKTFGGASTGRGASGEGGGREKKDERG